MVEVGIVIDDLASLYSSAEVKTPVARIVSEMLLLIMLLLFVFGLESDPSSSARASCMFPRRASAKNKVHTIMNFSLKHHQDILGKVLTEKKSPEREERNACLSALSSTFAYSLKCRDLRSWFIPEKSK